MQDLEGGGHVTMEKLSEVKLWGCEERSDAS